MEEYALVVELLNDILGKPRRYTDSSGQGAWDCPVCSYDIKGLERGDGKGNLEVNVQKNAFKCWACGESDDTHGNLFTLVRRWGNKAQLEQIRLILPEKFLPKEKKYQPVVLPDDFILFSEADRGIQLTHFYKQAYNYLKARGVSDEQIETYKLGFCYQGDYMGRIIIPSFDLNGKVNYFTGRAYTKHYQKYKNPEAEKDKIIFNERLINFKEDLYLVEGPFDHLFVKNSIPLLGKKLTDLLWEKLYTQAEKNIYILLDGDAWKDAERLYYKLNGGVLYGRVFVIRLPEDKDIADLKGTYENNWILQLEHE